MTTPKSDYNSNATRPYLRNKELLQSQNGVGVLSSVGGGIGKGVDIVGSNNFNCSLTSSHDFTHDNSDYQWFLDYGYRDCCSGMQRSVLSSFSTSYNALGDLIYYEDLAKNLDANLAEVDMESFRAEDINSLLSQLPSYFKNIGSVNSRLQQSLILHQREEQEYNNMIQSLRQTQFNTSQTSIASTNDLIDNSICKSELLFSPVKESHVSVDSLNMDSYPDDGDIILTCKANKDNYTIAFEGSFLYSDESFYEGDANGFNNEHNLMNSHDNFEEIVKVSGSSKVHQSLCEQAQDSQARLQRYPSGNNNTNAEGTPTKYLLPCRIRKCRSLPNLYEQNGASNCSLQRENEIQQHQLNVSQAVNLLMPETCKFHNLLPMGHVPDSITERFQEHQRGNPKIMLNTMSPPSQQYHQLKHRCSCAFASTNANSNDYCQKNSNACSSTNNSNPPVYNLVKLFIKQKKDYYGTGQAYTNPETQIQLSSGSFPTNNGRCLSSSLVDQLSRQQISISDSKKDCKVFLADKDAHCTNEDLANTESSSPITKQQKTVDNEFPKNSSISRTVNTGGLPNITQLRNPKSFHTSQTEFGQKTSDSNNFNSIPHIASEQKVEVKKLNAMHCLSQGSCAKMMSRSMQTSCGTATNQSSISARYPYVPPSFLSKLNNLGEERQAPIYVIYPSYALPDLGFVKTNSSTDLIFSPFNFKKIIEKAGINSIFKKRSSMGTDEIELLKTLDYKHILDWQSLVTLLPIEYRHRLQHIPEVQNLLQKLDAELSQRPLFCMTPPIRRKLSHVCDCTKYIQHLQNDEAYSSCYSHQPNSGYRCSSVLTDSESEFGDPLKPLYVYQYDQQRGDSGVEMSPVSRQTTPSDSLPRSILRRSHCKRNSMFEAQQIQALSKQEKRRSLQELPNNYVLNSTDELADLVEEEELPLTHNEGRCSPEGLIARARAEHFLASLPHSELKYYAEIAAVLNSSHDQVQYDAVALKKEVSQDLSQQKKVSFNDTKETQAKPIRLLTPPNSPNISIATIQRHDMLGNQDQRKSEINRFKRLKIQWELISKDSSKLKELAVSHSTKSRDSTPTNSTKTFTTPAAFAHRSRIPRPVSYPTGRYHIQDGPTCTSEAAHNKFKTISKANNKYGIVSPPKSNRLSTQALNTEMLKAPSPSRIVPPKRYCLKPINQPIGSTLERTPTNCNKVASSNTQKPTRNGVSQAFRPSSRII